MKTYTFDFIKNWYRYVYNIHVQCILQVLLFCSLYHWPQLPRRARANVTDWASGLWLGGRLLSISKSIKPVHECFLHLNLCLQYQTEEFKEEMKKKPQIVVCSAEFLALKEVRHPLIFRCLGQVMMIKISAGTFRAKCFQVKDTLLDCPLAPHGTRPIICVDECQVWTWFGRQ